MVEGDIKNEEIGSLKPGSYVIMDSDACEIKTIEKSKTGKHGSAKCRVTAISLLTGSKKVGLYVCSEKVEVPIIEKRSAQVLTIVDSNASVMDSESFENFDIAIPDEFKEKVVAGKEILYWNIIGRKVVKGTK